MDLFLSGKQELSPQELQILQSEMQKRQKSPVVMWLLWLFLGSVGAHRYYLGNTVQGVFMTITLSVAGLWALIDAFFITKRLRLVNEEIEREIMKDIITFRKSNANSLFVAATTE